MATMRALAKTSPGPGAELITVPIPQYGPHEVLVQVDVCSICGTDLHIYTWDAWSANRIKPPMVFGHEFAGRVVAAGDQVTSVQIGDLVSTETHIACERCKLCKTGNMHICQHTEIIGVDRDGSFAEFVVIPELNAWVNPPDINPELASLQEPLGNAVHTVLSGPVAGLSVAVLGCGPIGLLSLAVAARTGAACVYASDPSSYRRSLARQTGCTDVWDPSAEDVLEAARVATNGIGFDVVLEMSGHHEAVRQAFAIARFGGRVSLLGVPAGPVTIDLAEDIVFKGLTVQGITGRLMFDTWYQVSGLLTSGLVVDPIITHRLPMSQYEHAFDLMRTGSCGKIMLDPTQ